MSIVSALSPVKTIERVYRMDRGSAVILTVDIGIFAADCPKRRG